MMRALHSRRREVAVPAWAFLLFSVTLDEWLLHFFTLTEFSVIRFFCLTLFSLSFAAGLGFIVSPCAVWASSLSAMPSGSS